MNTTWTNISALALLLLLAACGGGGGSGGGTTSGGGGGTSATGVDWTWVGGSDTGGQPAVYTPASGVAAPGATEGASSWTDSSGNLWLFGGSDQTATQDVNDLWKFDINTNQWTWVNGNQGVANPLGNYGAVVGTTNAPDATGPGARQYAATWTDGNNNLWLFGGYVRIDSGGTITTAHANDLWKYNITNRQWTWVGGSKTPYQRGHYGMLGDAGNVPGARNGAAFWQDSSGNFWLFGGWGCDADTIASPCTKSSSSSGALNDLWKYSNNPAASDYQKWTFVSGSQVINQVGTYGSKGTPSGSNIPSGHYYGVSWIDSTGNLWLFGGKGYDTGGIGDFNDLWKYNPANNQWAWMSGDNKSGQLGVFGSAGTPSTAYVPGARRTAVSWKDSTGNFWLFGGAEDHPNNSTGTGTDNLNDLWKYNPANNQWTWMSGSNIPNQIGTYGTLGGTSPPESANVPGARDTAIAWVSGKACWLLGGQVFVTQGNFSTVPYNDFWKFVPK